MWTIQEEDVLYEDNHLIIVNKKAGINVQGDSSGDFPLVEAVRQFLKIKYNKPGNVFCGLIHRLDRPVSGIVVFAKTGKALSRMNQLFSENHPNKIYWAIVENPPIEKSAKLKHFLVRNEKQNKTYAYDEPKSNSKEARLSYVERLRSDKYSLLEVSLETGRHHQIRTQMAVIGCVIKGDLKYGAKRSNPDASISLHARKIEFSHPVSKENLCIIAPVPNDNLWRWFDERLK